MVAPFDAQGAARRLVEMADKDDQRPVVDRATFLPIGQYEDGGLTFAWPGFLKDAWDGAQRSYLDAAQVPVPDAPAGSTWSGPLDAFNAASIAPMAGVGMRAAGMAPSVGRASPKVAAGAYELVGGPGDPISPEYSVAQLIGMLPGAHADLLTDAAAQFRLSRRMGDGPVDAARAAFDYGRDLKGDLRSTWGEAWNEARAGDRTPFKYDIINNDGSAVGTASGSVAGDTMWFDWLGGRHDSPTPLGVKGLRQLREQVRKDFPGVKKFEGLRVSGAREGKSDSDAMQSVFLAANPDTAALPAIFGQVQQRDGSRPSLDRALRLHDQYMMGR